MKLKEFAKVTALGILFGILIAIVGIIIMLIFLYTSFQSNTFNNINLTSKDYKLITYISKDIANSHEYNLHKFDCTDFSRKLKNELIEVGYNATCIYGIYPKFTYPWHTWVEVKTSDETLWIEATNGNIYSEKDKEDFTVFGRGICW